MSINSTRQKAMVTTTNSKGGDQDSRSTNESGGEEPELSKSEENMRLGR